MDDRILDLLVLVGMEMHAQISTRDIYYVKSPSIVKDCVGEGEWRVIKDKS